MSRSSGAEVTLTKACWRAVATLSVDRAAARAQLQACFSAGTVPEALAGRTSGHFLTTTLGAAADPLCAAIARIWMPWKGKIFDHAEPSGRNWFSESARGLIQRLFPDYEGVTDDRRGTFAAFRFRTSAGPSRILRNRCVMHIDYDLPENPSWPIRRIADELVQIGADLYLGQALVRWGKGWHRAGWFALEGNDRSRPTER